MVKKYGVFNTKFLGASVYCDESYKVDALKDFLLNKRKDYFVENSAINTKNVEDVFLYNTAYFHEARHVHEFLLCPFLNYYLRLDILCSLHSIQFYVNSRHMGKRAINLIPIPLKDWFLLGDEEKQFNIECWKNSLGLSDVFAPNVTIPKNKSLRNLAESLFRGPHSGQDSLINLLIIAASYYEERQKCQRVFFDEGNCEYSTRAILESSAFVHQMTAISLMYGKAGNEYVNDSIQNIFNNKRFSVYTGIFTYIYRYLCSTGFDLQFQYPVTSYILYWCLSGNLLDADSIADPLMRLDLFTKHDLLHGITFKQLFNSPLAVFGYWDRKIGSIPIDYEQYKKTITFEYDKILYMLDGLNSKGYRDFSSYIKALKESTILMIERFIEKPSFFLMPQIYLENIYDFVNIPVRFVIKDKKLSIKKNDLEHRDDITLENSINGDFVEPGWIVSNCPRFNISDRYELLPPTADDIVLTYQMSEKARPFLLLSDALFSPRSVSSPEQIIKSVLPNVEVGFVL